MKKKINCVLLIDDDEPTTFLSQMVIEEAGLSKTIQVASSGADALAYLTSARDNRTADHWYPDLIFLDINMPAMNGWEFLQKYQDLDNRIKQDVIIIMLTTSLNPDDRLRAEAITSVRGFEHKPLTGEKLDGIVKKYFTESFDKKNSGSLPFPD